LLGPARFELATNYSPVRRTLRAVTPYYTRLNAGRKELVLKKKPGILQHLGSLNKKSNGQ
jgi:hypothetical protein